jgi:aminoglycoside/choline kinase family phosphotransferase
MSTSYVPGVKGLLASIAVAGVAVPEMAAPDTGSGIAALAELRCATRSARRRTRPFWIVV